MVARNGIVLIWKGLVSLLADTEPANVIVAAVWNQNMVEITKADGAVVLEHFSGLNCMVRPTAGKFVFELDVFSLDSGFDPHVICRFQNFDRKFFLNIRHYHCLLTYSLAVIVSEPPWGLMGSWLESKVVTVAIAAASAQMKIRMRDFQIANWAMTTGQSFWLLTRSLLVESGRPLNPPILSRLIWPKFVLTRIPLFLGSQAFEEAEAASLLLTSGHRAVHWSSLHFFLRLA